jgi:hypothetical protein
VKAHRRGAPCRRGSCAATAAPPWATAPPAGRGPLPASRFPSLPPASPPCHAAPAMQFPHVFSQALDTYCLQATSTMQRVFDVCYLLCGDSRSYLGVRRLLTKLRLLQPLLWSVLLRLPALLSGVTLVHSGSCAACDSAGGRLLEVVTPHPAIAAVACTRVSLTSKDFGSNRYAAGTVTAAFKGTTSDQPCSCCWVLSSSMHCKRCDRDISAHAGSRPSSACLLVACLRGLRWRQVGQHRPCAPAAARRRRLQSRGARRRARQLWRSHLHTACHHQSA